MQSLLYLPVILTTGIELGNRSSIEIKSSKKTAVIREFKYSELECATNFFSTDNFLGKGSHGSVYRAVIDNGKFTVAVKKTTIPNEVHYNRVNCTECITSPGENEVEILAKIRNPNLVNLIGFSSNSKDQKKLIVVEFMPNGSLYDLLHSNSRPPGWSRRIRFALHVGKAIGALHSSDPPVIHRDIKSSNVLIDHDGNARLGDFGLALRGHEEDVRVRCTPPAGTLGYLDPTYLSPGDLSTKNDVFSFGILLLEIITGRRAIDVDYSPPSVVDWAVPLINKREIERICDPRIGTPSDKTAIKNLAVLASRCVVSSARKRPPMTEVVNSLKEIYKRVQSPILNGLGCRVRFAGKSAPAARSSSEDDELIKIPKLGSRRKNRVSGTEINYDCTRGSDRVGRSKSIGSSSYTEIKTGTESNSGQTRRVGLIRRKHDVAVKLGKSRSMGLLQSSKLKRVVLVTNILEVEETMESKLLVSLDEEFKKESLEENKF